ncbi:hypothetical protein C0214_13675 [Methylobacterium sp. DM1]|nr:hypothetical protein C0214_13675 [Methylobacterium sp. DM1]
MASVRKRDKTDPASPWVCEYTDAEGKRRRYTPKTGLKKDADAFRRKVEAEIERGEHVAASETTTVQAAVANYLEECRARARAEDSLSASGVSMYTNALRRLSRHKLWTMRVKDLDRESLQASVTRMQDEGFGARSIAHTFGALCMALDLAITKRHLKVNPLRERSRERRVKLPTIRRQTRIPSREELSRLIRMASEKLRDDEEPYTAAARRAYVSFALDGGLRPCEVAALEWASVDLERKVIRVQQSRTRLNGLKGPKTVKGNREVTIVPDTEAALRDLRMLSSELRRSGNDFVFASRSGRSMTPETMASVYWFPLAKKLGWQVAPGKYKYRRYDLRHAAASLRIAIGLSPLHIKDFMGHANVNTTLGVYGHLFPEDDASKRAALSIAASLRSVASCDASAT